MHRISTIAIRMLFVQMLKDRSAVIASVVILETVHLAKVNVFHADYVAPVLLTFFGKKNLPLRQFERGKTHFMHMFFLDRYGITSSFYVNRYKRMFTKL